MPGLLDFFKTYLPFTPIGTWSPQADRLTIWQDQDDGSFIFAFWVAGVEMRFVVSREVGAPSVRQIRESAAAVH